MKKIFLALVMVLLSGCAHKQPLQIDHTKGYDAVIYDASKQKQLELPLIIRQIKVLPLLP